jgi:holo-[acyl-carrier protein] synthase
MSPEVARRRFKAAANRQVFAEFANHENPNLFNVTTSVYRRTGSRLYVGFDIVSVPEVAESLARFGDRYVHRIFTRREAHYCLAAAPAAAAARFAARFAAKEAAVKALQPESHWTDWRAIEVRRHKSGRCALVLRGAAALLASRRGIQDFALSMSHDGDRAAAIVVAFRDAPAGRHEP